MYNGIGLVTARGSGTSAHVTRNLSHLRPRDDYRSSQDRMDMPIKHRQPDASILDHERKRKIEIQCLELQDELEEKGLAEDEIERQVSELRKGLQTIGVPSSAQPQERGSIKEFQRHELLAAKAVDNDKFSRALGIRSNYVEGESLNKERQEELRQQKIAEREQRNADLAERRKMVEAQMEERKRTYEEEQLRMRAQRSERMERDRLVYEANANRQEERVKARQYGGGQAERPRDNGYSIRGAAQARNDDGTLRDSYRPGRDRSASPPPARRRDASLDRRRRSPSPLPRGGRRAPSSPSRSRSRSRSPLPRSRRARSYSSDSRSDSRGRSRTRSLSRSRSRSRSYSSRGSRSPSPYSKRRAGGRRDSRSRSRTPPRRGGRRDSRSRSPLPQSGKRRVSSRSPSPRAPPRRLRTRSPSPRAPVRRQRTRSPSPVVAKKDAPARAASESGSEDMDMDDGGTP